MSHQNRLEAWARSNRRELGLTGKDGEDKSLEMRQGVVGFRWTNRAVRLLRGVTDELVLEALRKLGKKARRWRRYIRVKEDLDRRQILADYRPEVARLADKDLERMGIELSREERFYVEPKLEKAPGAP